MNEQNNKGIYTKAVKIVDASVQYPSTKENWQKRKDDIVLTLTLDVGNDKFQPELVLRGYFNKKEDGSFQNNGTATKIRILFDSVGINADDAIDKEKFIDAVRNKWVRDYRPESNSQDQSNVEEKVDTNFQL